LNNTDIPKVVNLAKDPLSNEKCPECGSCKLEF